MTGASRLLFELSAQGAWELMSASYCIEETRKNLTKLGSIAIEVFDKEILSGITVTRDNYVIDRPMVYSVTKDKPVIASALACQAEALVTLDRGDFQQLLGVGVYSMMVVTPGDWIRQWRAAQRL